MRKIEITDADSAAVYRSLNASITHNLIRLAQARQRVKAALDLGETPDKRDVGNVEYYEFSVAALRRAKRQLEDEPEVDGDE